MNRLILFLLILICVVFLVAISTGAFIGAGYVISFILPLTLFQSTLLCIGATLVVAFIISAFVIGSPVLKYVEENDDYEDDDEDYEDEEDYDEDFEEDEELDDISKKRFTRLKTKVGRNDPCPCGSGKKYKNCCGKYNRS